MSRFELREFVLLSCRFELGQPPSSSGEIEDTEVDDSAPAGQGAPETHGEPTEEDPTVASGTDAAASAQADPAEEVAEDWPREDILKLDVSTFSDAGNYVLILSGRLDDPRLGFELEFNAGARFEVGESEGPEPTESQLRSTLTFMAFPYVRELVANLTARSPTGPYYLPPRAARPDPDAPER